MTQEQDFKGKVVLITGAASGIGEATALKFAERGAKVAIGDINEESNKVVQQIKDHGGEAVFFQTNVSNPEEVKALVEQTAAHFGKIDCAFNNAGVLPQIASFIDTTVEEFDKTIAVDLKGVFLCLKYELEYMVQAGGGSIVNTASVAGLIADPDMSPYVAAKHGVVGLTKAAGIEYADKGVRVNAVAPGVTATPLAKEKLEDPEIREEMIGNVPADRAAKPEEIAETVLYLSSDKASYVMAQTYVIDGGQIAH
ncbi:SDR family NAD(P)-dependent oxidoreductase [Oceanobacillus timonensis]|uniref:SDR family NAD(P)-dependent oxidoreductase n=1 Tax=Oceanobacillus timonensis TaxID=1926285 RepID=UPI001FEB01C2|nr:glucose 1-dehydrogenase [Oceanobacillus timonensis]